MMFEAEYRHEFKGWAIKVRIVLRRRYRGRAHRELQLIKSVLPAISCPYIQERAAQSLLLASYTPLKLCEEAMLSEAWTVPCTVGFLLKIASRSVKMAKIF